MRLLSYWLPKTPWLFVYMLQQVEYSTVKFMTWVTRFPDMNKVQKRQRLDKTGRAMLTVAVVYAVWLESIATGLFFISREQYFFGAISILLAPVAAIIALDVFNSLFGWLIVAPHERKQIDAAARKLKNMQTTSIAVMGSYGKTSMKEMLQTVLATGKTVAATPGNKNVLISHARWINQLTGSPEVLIFEYGEAKPGDIDELAQLSRPEYAVITGLAPAHLDDYGTLDAIAEDFQSITSYVDAANLFINAGSIELTDRLDHGVTYGESSTDGWSIADVRIGIEGVTFTMNKDKRTLKLQSQLLGRHNVGPLAAVVAIAARLGLTDEQIMEGVALTKPFEHRMQPRQVAGAWIIDDTYNGNIEGIKAGLALLRELPASRKIYVTPGLVEQGDMSEEVHRQLGNYIAQAAPDKVVLIRNSAIRFIQSGMEQGAFQGKLEIVDDPIHFYTHLEYELAAGDVVLMQNDWTDNYN